MIEPIIERLKRGISWMRTSVLAVFAAGFAVSAMAESFIVENGEPKATIVISEEPTRMQKLAAEQLREYVRKITGAELPIGSTPSAELPVKVYVGESEFTKNQGLEADDLDNGAYRIKSGDDWLALVGKDTNYFMDLPGDAGPEFAARATDRKRAAEAWRKKHGPKWSPAADGYKMYARKLGVWFTDDHGSLNAVNDFLRSLGVRWYMPGEFGEVCPKMKSIPLPTIDETVRPEWSQREMAFYGNRPHQGAREEILWQLRLGLHVDPKVWGVHGTANLLRPEWVKKNHPDFYALYGGERSTEGQGKACYSSKGLFKSAVDFSKLMFDQYGKNVVSLTPTDGYMCFCQCNLCKGKDTPKRGLRGMMSDYVWDFMNRAAAEVAKTHPDKKILCHAYNTYKKPPLKIERFHPNLQVSVCQNRSGFHDPKAKKNILDLREGFIKKLPAGKIGLHEYYFGVGGYPQYFPHLIGEDLKALEGHVNGTFIEVVRGGNSRKRKGPDPTLATNHLNLWLTARLWWSPDPAGLWWTDANSVDDVLDEYCAVFYGPAAKEMKTFIDYCEKNWPLMRSKPETIDKAFELIAVARKAAGKEGIHADRVQFIADYLEPMKLIREQLKVGRKGNPVAAFSDVDEDDVKLDGKLDETFWKDADTYELKDIMTGEAVNNKTAFKVVWAGDSLYFGVRCDEADMDKLVVPAPKSGDMSLFDGDMVELLLETPAHAYYQIAIDPEGHVNDLDRPNSIIIGKTGKYKTRWEAEATVATHKGDDFWSFEARIPAMGANQQKILPLFGVSGDKPSKDAPWHFNVGRVRAGDKGREVSMFSPTKAEGFHYMRKFAKLEPKK